MPFRLLTVAACLALAACSSADDMAEELGTDEATARATASASGQPALELEEETELYAFDYSYDAALDAPPGLAAYLEADATKLRSALIAEATAGQADSKAGDYEYRQHSLSKKWEVVADTPRFLSLSGNFATYSGGAHGMYGLESLVWDREAGAGMDGRAMFASPAALDAALSERLCAALNAERAERRGEPVPADGDGTFNDCVGTAEATVLVGSTNGRAFDRIGVWFGPYVAGSYAEGAYELDFPVDARVLGAVKPEYRAAFSAR